MVPKVRDGIAFMSKRATRHSDENGAGEFGGGAFFACCPTHQHDMRDASPLFAGCAGTSPFHCKYVEFYDELERMSGVEPRLDGAASAASKPKAA
jgi:hypothetical protein